MATSKENSSTIIERRAINPSGQLGYVYDACRDRLIDKSNTSCQEKHFPSSELPQCKLISGNTDESNNLLEWMGIQTELRLSLLLKLTKRDGIGAVLDYPGHIDECTRFLYYSWIGRELRLQEMSKLKEISVVWNRSINATHIITSVRVGIDVIIVLKLPSDVNTANKIDPILQKIRDILPRDKNNSLELSSEEKKALGNVISIQVYSNTPSLVTLCTIPKILEQIHAIKKKASSCSALSYTLQTITSLYPAHILKAAIYKPLSSNVENNIEKYMHMFRNAIKYLEPFLEGNQPKLLDIDSEHSLNDVKIQFSQTKNQYMSELQRFSMLIIDGRSNQATPSKIYHARHDPEQMALKESMHKLAQSLKGLNIKIFSSTSLRQKILECLNAVEHCLNENNDARTIERKPIKHNPCNQNLESQDNSKSEDRFNSNIQRQRSNRGHANNSPRSPPAVSSLDSPIRKGNTATSPSDAINHSTDHSKRRPSSPERSLSTSLASPSSSSSIKATSPSDEIKYSKDYSKQRASSSESSSPTSPTSPLSSSSTDDIINILLLGETGVGKSTFINAFANYLAFNSLEQAQTNEPIVLIPVSFIMTTGDNFEEQTIKFGEYDSSNNENFNNVGQSVTQHCKSYTFALHQYDGKKLRIIDTPGFGDTRGLEQDDQNMEHILQYISRLTHLNAICFLLKPNSSRLNMFFRTCLTQLFSFLAPTARKNVIFCFTNARSTFYTPGDTSPLLKAMLADSSMSDIPFKKDNTFCFDSESFRYLVALRNKITFSDDDEREYRTSWSTSVKESTRAIDYINENLTVHPIENELQSIKQVQFEISHMIRPILEAMRNILRNMILCENKLSNQFIKLNPTALHRTDVLYHSCRSNPEQVGKFWIIPNVSVETQDDSLECSCTLDQSVQMDYVLKHECLDGVVDRHQHATEKTLQMLCNASTELAHFLMHVAYSTKHDPFLIGLKTMIDEETYICRTQEQAQFNKKLIEKLRLLENDYIQKRNEMKPNQKYMGLPAMCKFVKTISEWPLVREQLIAVKKTQQSMMEQYEYETQKI